MIIRSNRVAVKILGTEQNMKPKKELSETSCYVLITCGEPSQDGKMEVEMSYSGDPALAAYLVESAHNIIDMEYDKH